MQLVRDKNPACSILFGVAAIQLLIGLLGWFVHRENPNVEMPELKWFLYSFQSGAFTWLDWALTFSGAIYVILGFVARSATLPAALFAAAIYAGFLGRNCTHVHFCCAITLVAYFRFRKSQPDNSSGYLFERSIAGRNSPSDTFLYARRTG